MSLFAGLVGAPKADESNGDALFGNANVFRRSTNAPKAEPKARKRNRTKAPGGGLAGDAAPSASAPRVDSKASKRKASASADGEAAGGSKRRAADGGGEHPAQRRIASAQRASSSAPARSDSKKPSTHGSGASDDAEKTRRTLFVGNIPPSMTSKQLKRLFAEFGSVESVRFRATPLDGLHEKLPYRNTDLARRIAGIKGAASRGASADASGKAPRTLKGFVVFGDREAAVKACEMNMRVVQGKHLLVNFAAHAKGSEGGKGSEDSSGGALFAPNRSVFLGNLRLDCGEEDVIALFEKSDHVPQVQGALDAVRVIQDRCVRSPPIAPSPSLPLLPSPDPLLGVQSDLTSPSRHRPSLSPFLPYFRKTGVGKGFGYALFKTPGAAQAALDLDGADVRGRAVRISKVKKNATPSSAPARNDKHGYRVQAGKATVAKDARGKGRFHPGAKARHGNGRNGRTERPGGGAPAWQGLKAKTAERSKGPSKAGAFPRKEKGRRPTTKGKK